MTLASFNANFAVLLSHPECGFGPMVRSKRVERPIRIGQDLNSIILPYKDRHFRASFASEYS